MDLRQLEYFVRVAELGSFTRAAIALDIAQPALSRQVRLLEVELRQSLLTRNGRGATPTEAGKLLLEHGRGILHQVERAREELGRVRGALAGRVAIGLPPSVAKLMAVPLVREFSKRMPEASISISEALSTASLEALMTGRLDIALLYNATAAPGIELTPLLEEPLFLVQRSTLGAAQKARPVALRDVAQIPLIIPSRPNAIRMQVEGEMAALGCRPQVALEIDGVPAILDLVEDGAGSAVLSRNAVATSGRPEAFVCRPITAPALHSKLVMAMSSQRPATLTQKAMLELIQALAVKLLSPA
ncbi:LysR substrate-binding domain-containing protein [Caenimonas sp. SL110]|uniref:LysR substrate-binding domain-containing protein n=1 Tax=Caenimonas sp. SL110 TaxID=1450524 RepID=UPI0006537B83|nr:LysR substrate-binding domain-containing protein [Caenimonas sp. SL110]